MNKAQKIIWVIYLEIFAVLAVRALSYIKDQHNSHDAIFRDYLFYGWIPALSLHFIFHFIWRDKKK